MTKPEIVQMDAAYRAEYRHRRNNKLYRDWVMENFPVAIPVVEKTEAPVVCSIPFAGETLEWRLVNGVMMRPMLNDEGKPCGTEGLTQRRLDTGYHVIQATRLLMDHPETICHYAVPGALWDLRYSWDRKDVENGQSTPTPGEFWKWHVDEREAARERVERTASTDLAIIDGVLHRKALEPSIIVTFNTQDGVIVPVISYDVPEMHDLINKSKGWGVRAAAFFSLTEMDLALRFVERCVENPPEGATLENIDIRRMQNPEDEALIYNGWEPSGRSTSMAAALTINRLLYRPRGEAEGPRISAAAVELLRAAVRAPATGRAPIDHEQAYELFLRFSTEEGADRDHRRLASALIAADEMRVTHMIGNDEALAGLRI